MKVSSRSITSATVLLASVWTSFLIGMVDSYISPIPNGPWDPSKGFQNKQHQHQQQQHQPQPTEASQNMAEPAANVQVEDIFRAEYHDWAKRYGKNDDTLDATRFENFKLNFMLQMQHNKETGIFYLLNEFGDMTSHEYNELMTSQGIPSRADGDGKMKKKSPMNNAGEDTFAKATVKPASHKGGRHASWKPSRDNDKISGADVVEALAKTAQEYQSFLSRKSANRRRRNSSSKSRKASNDDGAKPKAPFKRSEPSFSEEQLEQQHQQLREFMDRYDSPTQEEQLDLQQQQLQEFMDGYNTQPRVTAPTEKKATEPIETSKGYSVIAELVTDPPVQDTEEEETAFYEGTSTIPRVSAPKVQAMGVNPNDQVMDGCRTRPGTLESKFFKTVKGKPSNKSFFTGIGTQVVGVSSTKRLVRWEPGMDEWP